MDNLKSNPPKRKAVKSNENSDELLLYPFGEFRVYHPTQFFEVAGQPHFHIQNEWLNSKKKKYPLVY
jgi:hypothetical protein